MNDRFAGIRRELEESVLAGPGESTRELRVAAAENQGLPEELRALVEKIHHHAYRITDEEVAALREKYSDDQLYELFCAAATGAARARLQKGLAVVAMLAEGGVNAAAQNR